MKKLFNIWQTERKLKHANQKLVQLLTPHLTEQTTVESIRETIENGVNHQIKITNLIGHLKTLQLDEHYHLTGQPYLATLNAFQTYAANLSLNHAIKQLHTYQHDPHYQAALYQQLDPVHKDINAVTQLILKHLTLDEPPLEHTPANALTNEQQQLLIHRIAQLLQAPDYQEQYRSFQWLDLVFDADDQIAFANLKTALLKIVDQYQTFEQQWVQLNLVEQLFQLIGTPTRLVIPTKLTTADLITNPTKQRIELIEVTATAQVFIQSYCQKLFQSLSWSKPLFKDLGQIQALLMRKSQQFGYDNWRYVSFAAILHHAVNTINEPK